MRSTLTSLPIEIEIPGEGFEDFEDSDGAVTPQNQVFNEGYMSSGGYEARKNRVVQAPRKSLIANPLESIDNKKLDLLIENSPESQWPFTIKPRVKDSIDMNDVAKHKKEGFFKNYNFTGWVGEGDTGIIMKCKPNRFEGFGEAPEFAVKIQIVTDEDNYNGVTQVDFERIVREATDKYGVFRELQFRKHTVGPKEYLKTIKSLERGAFTNGSFQLIDYYLEDVKPEFISFFVMKLYDTDLQKKWRDESGNKELESNHALRNRIQNERVHALFKIVSTLKEFINVGLLYTDVKTNNVFVEESKYGPIYDIGDFGDARSIPCASGHWSNFIERLVMLCNNVFDLKQMQRVRDMVPQGPYDENGENCQKLIETVLEICSERVRHVDDEKVVRELKTDVDIMNRKLKRKDKVIGRQQIEIDDLTSNLEILIENSDPELLDKLNIKMPVKKKRKKRKSKIESILMLEDEKEEKVLGKRKREVREKEWVLDEDSKRQKTE